MVRMQTGCVEGFAARPEDMRRGFGRDLPALGSGADRFARQVAAPAARQLIDRGTRNTSYGLGRLHVASLLAVRQHASG